MEGRPGRGEDSSYEVVRSYVDQLTCVTLRTELYEKQDDLAKILLADPTRIERHDGRNIPFLIRAEDKKLGTSSELQVESIEMGKDIPRKHFSERALQVRN